MQRSLSIKSFRQFSFFPFIRFFSYHKKAKTETKNNRKRVSELQS